MAWPFLLPFLLLGAAPVAVDPALLAPGARELLAAMEGTRKDADNADIYAVAVARVHALLVERLAAGAEIACDDVGLVPYLARSTALLSGWRDATQSARADLGRLQRLEAERSLEALLDDVTRAELQALRDRVDRAVPACQEALAWQARYVNPILARCAPPLEPGPGLPSQFPWVPESETGPVAVVVLPGGFLCPDDVPGHGQALIVRSGEACYGVEDCACFVAPVLPGAALGVLPPAGVPLPEEVGDAAPPDQGSPPAPAGAAAPEAAPIP